MSENKQNPTNSNRRGFLQAAGTSLSVAGAVLASGGKAIARPLTEKDKLDRIASNTWPIRSLFKRRSSGRTPSEKDVAFKKKYGEMTMLDVGQFTKDVFPGVTHMDLWSSLFGDVTDDSMFASEEYSRGGRTRTRYEFDPGTAIGQEVARQAHGYDCKNRRQVPSHLEQRAPQYL